MTSFILKTLCHLKKKNENLSDLIFVLPSKRAGAFLRKEISNLTDKPVFSPEVLSIQEFMEKVSELKTLDSTTIVFEFYSVYKKYTPKENIEKFENFSTWAQTLVGDFNEIDRYLVPPERIFNYLSEIKDINHWSLQPEKTQMVENYLAFWRRLPHYYKELRANLLRKKWAYQGLVYRRASEVIEDFARNNAQQFVFIGFNSLSSAEQLIIQKMLEYGAQIFWDLDERHFRDKEHDASLFIRTYADTWPYYKTNELKFLSSEFSSEKEIELAGIPKNIGQAKYVGQILESMSAEELENTAVVLGDESLLLPVINSLPSHIGKLNITMGYPLKYSQYSSLFDKYFELLKLETGSFYYKDVIAVLSNPELRKAGNLACEKVIRRIRAENILYLTREEIIGMFPEVQGELISLCFPSAGLSVEQILENFEKLISLLKAAETENAPLKREFLYHHQKVVEQLWKLAKDYDHITAVGSLHHFYKEIISQQTLDFQGEPFEGLQLMGLLESRVLDFETVILTSVNEGILPAGKTTNSFIPYDLKRTFQLPTYKEKDAVYTYHFYHLIQRAKKIHLLHNTDTESSMGGEKSRFLLQLEIDKPPLHKLFNTVVIPEIPSATPGLKSVKKTPQILQRIKEIAQSGFSPSALTTYIRNPLDFYTQYILKIRDKEEVEETVALNTLGTVIHDTLEIFYSPFRGKSLNADDLELFKKRVPAEVKTQFEKTYSKVPLDRGKNLLILKVAQRYLLNFLKKEMEQLKSGADIRLLEIETKLTSPIDVEGVNFPVNIRGTVDRVDICDGVLRVIDYKTGKVLQNQLEITEWEEINTDYDKFSKPFQVLMYASIFLKDNRENLPVEAGVISFKNLKSGFLKFAKKEKPRGGKKLNLIDKDILEKFDAQLKILIREICDPEIPFTEKEIKENYGTY